MSFFYPTVGALAILAVFLFLVGRQNRDLLRARVYGEFVVRLLPLLSAGVFVAALPFVVGLARFEDTVSVLLVYLGGAVVLTVLMARLAAPEERHAGVLFAREEYEAAAEAYEHLAARRPLPRYYSALAASLDASGDPHAALEAADTAVKLDPRLGIALYNRASALAATGDPARAREDLNAVFRADSTRRLKHAAEEALKSLDKGRY